MASSAFSFSDDTKVNLLMLLVKNGEDYLEMKEKIWKFAPQKRRR